MDSEINVRNIDAASPTELLHFVSINILGQFEINEVVLVLLKSIKTDKSTGPDGELRRNRRDCRNLDKGFCIFSSRRPCLESSQCGFFI